jgi:hypothetical protein
LDLSVAGIIRARSKPKTSIYSSRDDRTNAVAVGDLANNPQPGCCSSRFETSKFNEIKRGESFVDRFWTIKGLGLK